MQQHIAFLQRKQARFPFGRDRAFLRQQRTGAELEDDLPKFGVVDPVFPFVETPDAAGHDDRHAIGNALLAHRVAQRLDARIRILRLARILGVGQPVVPARQPRVFVDDSGKPFGRLVIRTFPERAERARRADDRQVIDAVRGCDLAELVGHSRAAGDAGHQPLGAFEHALEHALRAAHFPQDVDVDRALARCHLVCALDLRDGAVDSVFDQFFMPFRMLFSSK